MKKILLDTDIGPDCDDAGALALLHVFADRGMCQILGIGHCTSNPYGAGAIDVISRYYGRPGIDIGTYYGEGFLTSQEHMSYNKYLTTEFENRYQTEQPEEAAVMYRRILSQQEDNSVEFIAIGPLNNLSALLNSQPDSFSELDGISLVKQKVRRLVLMGGLFSLFSEEKNEMIKHISRKEQEEMGEFNIVCDIPAAQNVALHWPTPKVYIGLEIGLMRTGKSLTTHAPENHPVRIAYQRYNRDRALPDNYSWDLLTVEYAVVDDCPHYKCSASGKAYFDDKGRTLWTADENGLDCFVELAQSGEKIAEDIDIILATPPRTLD